MIESNANQSKVKCKFSRGSAAMYPLVVLLALGSTSCIMILFVGYEV